MSNSPPLSATAAFPGFGGGLVSWLASPVERRLFNYFKAFFALKLYLGPVLGLGPDGALPSLASLAHAASTGPSLILLLVWEMVTSNSYRQQERQMLGLASGLAERMPKYTSSSLESQARERRCWLQLWLRSWP